MAPKVPCLNAPLTTCNKTLTKNSTFAEMLSCNSASLQLRLTLGQSCLQGPSRQNASAAVRKRSPCFYFVLREVLQTILVKVITKMCDFDS